MLFILLKYCFSLFPLLSWFIQSCTIHPFFSASANFIETFFPWNTSLQSIVGELPFRATAVSRSSSCSYNINVLWPPATPQYDISSRFEKLLRVNVVNELSEYLRQNEIRNKGTTSNIGYVKYGGWIEKKKLMNNSNTDIFSLFLQ